MWNDEIVEHLLNSLNSCKACMGLQDPNSKVFSMILEISVMT